MSARGSRLARLRDLLLLVAVTVASLLCVAMLAGWTWFRALFFSAFGMLPLPLAGLFGGLAVLAGAAYVLAPPPRPADAAPRLKGE